MEFLPNQVIAKIFSLTDDETIFNFSCVCKLYFNVMNVAKNEITFQKNNEITYGLNILKECIPEFGVVPYDVYNFEHINVINNYIEQNINTIEHKYHLSCPYHDKRYTTYYFNAELLINDLLTSVKVKGEIYRITFEFQASGSFYSNITDGLLNILPTDENDYKEVLSYFVPYVYFRLFPFSNILLKIQHIGDIDIQTTFVNFDNHHRNIIENLTFRRCNTVFTHTIIPDMLLSISFDHSSKCILRQVYPSFISKGFIIVLKENNCIFENPCDIIKSIEIDCYCRGSPNVITKTYKFNSKYLIVNKVINKGYYNLNFKIKNNCLYIPLDNVNFRHISQTIFKVIFYDNIKAEGVMDIIYLGHNMIMNKDGISSRYYW